ELVHIRTILEVEQFNREHVSVFELRGNELIADQFAAASLADGFVTLKDLPAGDFRVSLLEETGERTVLVRIADGVRDQQHIFGSSRKLTTELLDELQIAESKVVGDKLQIRLAQGSKFARVHVFANTFRPEYSPLLLSTNRPGLATQGMAIARSLYVEGRNIGDEYRYILDRRYADKYPGNMNTRPGILLNPWDIRTTQTGTQDAAKGDNFAPKAAAPALRAAVDAEQLGRMAQIAAGQEPPNLDFLADSAVVLPNLVPNEDGSITINLEDLGGHQEVHIVALDPINTVWKSVSLPKKEMKSLDLRLASGFDPKKDFSQQKKISVIKSGETFELEDLSTSQMVMYDSLRGVFQLFETLDGNENLAKFRFVLDWPTLDEDKKRDLYSEHACHELNYFVFRRDPKFFGDVVKPYLTNKFDKTFLDEWLLGADVSRHVQPYLYARLNTFERILLAQRIESEREASRRFVIDQYDLLPPNTAESQRLFATALKASSLGLAFGDDDAGGFGGAGGGLGGGGFGGGGVRAYSGAAIEMEAAPAFSRESLKELGVSEKKSGGGTELSRKRKARAGKGVARRSAGRQMLGADDDEIESLYEQRGLAERGRRQLFRQVDKTKEWAENNYYRLPLEKQDSSLVRVDGFWADYASHHDGPFVSAHVAEAANSFTEMMLALAVLDLPFESSEHKIDKADGRLSMTTASAGIIVHEQIRPAKEADDKPPVLVGQNFFRADDRHRIENNQKVDKFVTDEFLIHTVYGAQVVITNPTSTPRILTGLVQIPQGALPVAGAKYTESKTLQLDPYATKTIEYLFYFPTPGQFAHYPIHVARDGEMVAEAQAFTFNVVTEPTSVDQESWEYVSQYASADDVLKYLRENNLNRIELSRIAWRMQDKTFFKKSTELLDERHQFDHTLWSYAAHHNDKNRLTEFLRNDPKFVAECGAVLDSPLLTIDPVERRTYEFFEYKPLVNARAHKLGADRKILNDRFSKQYASLMTVLSQRDKLTDRDLLSVSYYMLLQDRIGDALDYFGQVNPENLPSKLQHDYFAAYADFYSKGLATAKAMVDRYTDYPVKHWREMFASMGQQIKEIEGDKPEVPESADPKNRDDQIARLAAADCSLDIAVDRTEVQVDFENLQSVQVNYYLMDIELLFSRNPFVQGPSGHFSHVKPNEKTTLQLPRDKTRFRFELPKDLQNRNVLVEVVGRGQTQTAAYYSNSLSLQTIDNYGQLKVTSVKDNAALSG
ncbi:MAG: hypothetical protein AB8G99_12185, partial [Planctomycetaceae bacterium]